MSVTGILPTYQRFVNGVPIPLRKSFRPREKSVICLVFATFCLVCFGTFFYLPEFKSSGGRVESVYKVYDQIKKAGPDLLIPPPPQLEDTREAQKFLRHEEDAREDPHIIGDREKLKAKIEEDHELKVLERPDQAVDIPKQSVSPSGDPLHPELQDSAPANQIDEILGRNAVTVSAAHAKVYPLKQGGEDREESVRFKRDKVKEAVVAGNCKQARKQFPPTTAFRPESRAPVHQLAVKALTN